MSAYGIKIPSFSLTILNKKNNDKQTQDFIFYLIINVYFYLFCEEFKDVAKQDMINYCLENKMYPVNESFNKFIAEKLYMDEFVMIHETEPKGFDNDWKCKTGWYTNMILTKDDFDDNNADKIKITMVNKDETRYLQWMHWM